MVRVGTNLSDKVKGEQILVFFEKEKWRKEKIRKSGAHRGICSVFEGNVECIIELPIRRKVRQI